MAPLSEENLLTRARWRTAIINSILAVTNFMNSDT